MASVNITKCHGSAAASILAHNHRHDGKDVQYRNEHIDKSKTTSNSYRYFKGQDPAATSKDEYQRLRARVEEIDKAEPPKRIRKDRVTMVAFEVPVPADLPADQEGKFFSLAYKEIARMCGGSANVSTMRIHRDEVHEYVDPVTKERRTSRVHAHVVGIPYVKGKGVNCKNFMSRQTLRDLQRRLDDKCRQELGVAFMDGSRQKSRGTVEDLKRASARTEQELAERIAEKERRIADLDAQAVKSTQEAEKAAQEAREAQNTAIWAQATMEDTERLKNQLDRIADQVDHARRRAALQDEMRAWLTRKYPEVVEEYDRYVERTANMVRRTRRSLDDLER